MKKFIKERRQWYDFRPALIWQMQTSINEVLIASQLKTQNEIIQVRPEMAMMVQAILRVSLKPELLSGLPDWIEIQNGLERFRDQYVVYLGKNTGIRKARIK